MQGTILVAVDGSIASQNAANIAVQFAQKGNLSIHGVYVVDEPLVLDPYSDCSSELGWDAVPNSRSGRIEVFEARGRLVLDELQAKCLRVNVRIATEIVLGDVPILILDKSQEASMLALGRRGNCHAADATHLGEYFLRIARHARVPLLVGGNTDRDLNRLLLVCDVNIMAGSLLDWAARLHQNFGLDILVGVEGQKGSKEDLEQVRKWLESRGIYDFSLVEFGSESGSGFERVLKESQADLILMHGNKHPVFMDAILGNQTNEIIRRTQIPILLT